MQVMSRRPTLVAILKKTVHFLDRLGNVVVPGGETRNARRAIAERSASKTAANRASAISVPGRVTGAQKRARSTSEGVSDNVLMRTPWIRKGQARERGPIAHEAGRDSSHLSNRNAVWSSLSPARHDSMDRAETARTGEGVLRGTSSVPVEAKPIFRPDVI
jgi:hypothetical protein